MIRLKGYHLLISIECIYISSLVLGLFDVTKIISELGVICFLSEWTEKKDVLIAKLRKEKLDFENQF